MRKQRLVESYCGTAALVEGTSSNGPMIVRGEFARVGHPTQNQRVYPMPIWESEMRRLNSPLKERRWYGELDHPEDGKTMLTRASHIVTKLWLEGDRVMGEAEILNTPKGQILRALLEAKCPVGVSSRGYGDVVASPQGHQVVQEGFRLDAFDFVGDPADATAFPKVVQESVEDPTKPLLFEGVAFPEPDVSTLASQMLARLRANKPAAGDPAPAPAAPPARPPVAPAAPLSEGTQPLQEARLVALEEENRRLRRQTVDAGCVLLAQKLMQEDEDHALVLRLLGDTALYESIDAYASRMRTIQEAVAEHRAAFEARHQRLAAKLTETKTELAESYKEMDTLRAQLEEAVRVVGEARLRLLAERRLSNHPHAASIRPILDATTLASEAHLDTIFEQYRTPTRTVLETERMADRIRHTVMEGRGHRASAADEETPWQRPQEKLPHDPVAAIKALAERYMPSGL